jgi:hypothetical protein
MADIVILNEKQISVEELEEKKKEVEREPDIQIVEVAKDTYKTRIQS